MFGIICLDSLEKILEIFLLIESLNNICEVEQILELVLERVVVKMMKLMILVVLVILILVKVFMNGELIEFNWFYGQIEMIMKMVLMQKIRICQIMDLMDLIIVYFGEEDLLVVIFNNLIFWQDLVIMDRENMKFIYLLVKKLLWFYKLEILIGCQWFLNFSIIIINFKMIMMMIVIILIMVNQNFRCLQVLVLVRLVVVKMVIIMIFDIQFGRLGYQ